MQRGEAPWPVTPEAREEFEAALRNARLAALSVAQPPPGEEREDLVGIALEAVCLSWLNFCPDRGSSFAHYAKLQVGFALKAARRGRGRKRGELLPWQQPALSWNALWAGLDEPEEPWNTDPRPGTDEIAIRLDVRADLRAALARLQPRQTYILVRHYFQECSDAVIAAELGLDPSPVGQLRRRALAELREFLVSQGFEG